MFRGGVIGLLVGLSAIVFGQGYSENWRAITTPSEPNEVIIWHKVKATSTNEVIAFGVAQTGTPPPNHGPAEDLTHTILLAKFSADGNPIWITRDFSGLAQNVRPIAMDVDGAGNAYVTYNTSPGFANVDSYAAATGAFRWSFTVQVDPDDDQPVKLAVRSSGNSTFVYAGTNRLNGTVPVYDLRRFNSVDASVTHVGTVSGANSARLQEMLTDVNGNVIVGGAVDGDGDVRKFSQALSPVWTASFPDAGKAQITFDPITNSVLAGFSFPAPQRGVFRINAVNGTVQNSKIFNGEISRVGTLQPGAFGSWLVEVESGEGIQLLGFTSTLAPYFSDFASKNIGGMVADTSGQVHFGSVGLNNTLVAVRRLPAAGLFETAFGTVAITTAVTTDSLGRVIAAGRNIAGEGIVLQLDQQFLANTDVLVRDFTGPLTIGAPGVLANDSNWFGGTLSVVTQPADGTVTLNQDGSFEYVPGPTYDGTDQFQYRITKNGVPRTATCVVKQALITQLSTFEPTVIGEDFINGTIAINNANLASDFEPAVSFSSPTITQLIPIRFRPGQTQDQFSLRTKPVSVSLPVTMTVTASGQSRSTSFTVLPGGMQSMTAVNNAPLLEGQSSIVIVRLTGVVQEERRYNLDEIGPINAPSSVTIPAGQSTASISVTVPTGSAGQTPSLKVFTGDGPREFFFTIQARPKLELMETVENILYAGTTFRLRARLDGRAGTSSATVFLSDTSTAVQTPASIVVPAGAQSGIATITANLTAANTNVTFTGIFEGVQKTVTVLIRNNLLENFTVPNVMTIRQTVQGTVFLNWVATGRGQDVLITVSKPALLNAPAKITIPAGQTNAQFNIKTFGVAGTSTITVRIGEKAITKSITITP